VCVDPLLLRYKVVSKYAMPAQMWRHGIHSFPNYYDMDHWIRLIICFYLPGLLDDGSVESRCRLSKIPGLMAYLVANCSLGLMKQLGTTSAMKPNRSPDIECSHGIGCSYGIKCSHGTRCSRGLGCL
jgi:hypothetical protein